MPKRRNVRRVQEDYEETAPTRTSNTRGGERGARKYQPDSNVLSFNTYVQQRKTVSLVPRSLKQEEYVNNLLDPDKTIVFATGPAGTGKTMLGVLAAIKAFKAGTVEKIIITRPAVGVDDEKHGFLPGTLNEKMEPWTRPIFDVIKEYYSPKEVAYMLETEVIEISPLAYMRGRNLKKAFIIADEMQNSSVNQLLMLLTRISDGSRLVVTGDLDQVDRQFAKTNGLIDFFAKFEGYKGDAIGATRFEVQDVQRHPIVTEILNLYKPESK